MKNLKRILSSAVFIAFVFFAMHGDLILKVAAQKNSAPSVSQNIVISQFYGSGGSAGAVYKNDYVELFNRGTTSASLNGWSIQYASVSGTNWLLTTLPNATLAPGQYYLIQMASNGAIGADLPTADFIAPPTTAEGFIPNLSGSTGKLALSNLGVKLPAQTCPSDPSIVDLVGYGPTVTCFETTATPVLTLTTAAIRNGNGCVDTDNNSLDFSIGVPAPRNTASAPSPCTGGGNVISGSGSASPTSVMPANPVIFRVAVNPATTPPSTGITVVGNLTNISGPGTQQFFDDGTNGDTTAGDNIFSYQYTIPLTTTGGQKSVPYTVADAQARSFSGAIGISVIGNVVITDNPLILGNPSEATNDVNFPTNYLMQKPQYSLSYNRDRGIPNWVAWRLDSSWIGTTPRQDDYRGDTDLPVGWYQVQTSDYTGGGYDRGHMCPSGDRTNSVPNNSATFLMTNFIPQLAANNQGPWEDFESYCRTLASAGNEIYIVSGGNGTAGTIAGGKVTVPLVTWKVALVLPNGDNDLSRIGKTTRTIAIIIPNQPPVDINGVWRTYRTTVDKVEALTGLNFFSNVSLNTQSIIERRKDNL